MFSFEFTSTHRDLLDSFDAERTVSTGMRGWIHLRFDDNSITVHAAGIGEFHRSWQEVAGMHPAAKGLLFAFDDGSLHWLPNRVFRDTAAREALIEYVAQRLEHAPAAGGAA